MGEVTLYQKVLSYYSDIFVVFEVCDIEMTKEGFREFFNEEPNYFNGMVTGYHSAKGLPEDLHLITGYTNNMTYDQTIDFLEDLINATDYFEDEE